MEKRRRVITSIVIASVIFVALVVTLIFTNITTEADPKEDSYTSLLTDDYDYSSFLNDNKSFDIITDEKVSLKASSFNDTRELLSKTDNYGYDSESFLWDDTLDITIKVEVSKKGLYQIYLDYYSLASSVSPIELSVYINNKVQYSEADQIVLDTLYHETSTTPSLDRYGNEVNILQDVYYTWQNAALRDGTRLYYGGNKFLLEEGENIITIKKLDGNLILGDIEIKNEGNLINYSEYINQYTDTSTSYFERIEAENMTYKNSSSISISTSRDLLVLPYSLSKNKLNIIGNGSFNKSGDSATWTVKVDEAGYYNLAFKVKQSNRNNSSYRTLYVNGEVPFEEAKHLVFSYNKKWQNVAISSFSGDEYKIYLEKGTNTITLEVDSTLFEAVSSTLSKITNEMNELGLNVKKITGNNTDKGIDWDMLAYFPNLIQTLNSWKNSLSDIITYLHSISGFSENSYETRDLETVIEYINKILKDVNELPRKLGLLSEGDSCSAQILASHIDSITYQPIVMDALFIYTSDREASIGKANANFLTKAWVGFERFFLSFFDKSLNEKSEDGELEIWVNRSRIYVDKLQQIADSEFTTKTGIKVKISLMNDEGKLVLSNAADEQPDIALGVSAWIPNEYGMRGAIYDLRNFKDLEDVISVYSYEELIPGIYDEHLYSLPETENFYVLFAREDILSSLNLTIPDTWDDVIDMLPTLSRYGMSFYIPLSSSSSTKSFDSTSPFIFQNGGSLYNSDATGTAIDQEQCITALTFMTDLYKEYGLSYNVTSFFNEFRYGTIPIGIADFGTYLQLLNGAPELSGLWSISVVPGTKSSDGNIYRYMSGAQQSMMIFEKSQMKEEAWEFLKWWSSTETQMNYSETLLNTYGMAYLWNTANLEAFAKLGWPKEDKKVILEQWTYLKEVPKIPGSYIIEREISNIWNAVVFDDDNLRSEVSDATIRINREVLRKLKQFGYYDSAGIKERDVILPSVENIKSWFGD